MVSDLLGLMFYSGPVGFESEDGLDVQRGVLERVPSQISGLKLRLEEAEDAPPKSVPQQPWEINPNKSSRWAWLNNPWIVAIGSGIVLLALAAWLFH